jgi:hypothetical protein
MCGLATGDTTYTDPILTAAIERYPLMDPTGLVWFLWDYTTYPPHQDTNDDWVATYDLNAAAADVLDEKSATLMTSFDFSADGANMSLSQKYQQTQALARHYRARRSASTIEQVIKPRPEDEELDWPHERDL